MKSYPSISKEIQDVEIYAFDKLDGSNIRAEWDSKKGFYKYGSRTRLLDPNEKPLGEAVQLITAKYAEGLNKIFKAERYQSAVCFFEFYGANSFAGNHAEEEHTVTLIDVAPYKKGMIVPNQFIKMFSHLGIPNVVYHGKANSILIDQIKNGTLPNVTFEGVVCKGINRNQITMFKIKSNGWLEKLKAHCGENQKLFEQLV